MWINRDIETIIMAYKDQFPAILITGARQVGKTSLLTHLFPEASYISLDDPHQAANAENFPDKFLKGLKTPAIIDEAQYAPGLFRYLKISIDKSKANGQYFITGSQHFSLMQNATESLAGRCGIINLHTLSAKEVTEFNKKLNLEDYILKGGFPALHSQKNLNANYWYSSYIATYLERDVRNITHVINLRDFNRFIRALAIRTGRILTLSDLARDVGMAPNTIKSWISILQTSQHIYLLEPYYANRGKRLVKSPKIYFCDTGLAAHLMGINTWEELTRSPIAGALWETYVLNQILKYFNNSGQSNPNLWFWRTNIGEEVDFLIEKGSRFYTIECKLTANPGEKDLKGFNALKRYYGEESIINSFLACKVETVFAFNKEILVSPFINCEILGSNRETKPVSNL